MSCHVTFSSSSGLEYTLEAPLFVSHTFNNLLELNIWAFFHVKCIRISSLYIFINMITVIIPSYLVDTIIYVSRMNLWRVGRKLAYVYFIENATHGSLSLNHNKCHTLWFMSISEQVVAWPVWKYKKRLMSSYNSIKINSEPEWLLFLALGVLVIWTMEWTFCWENILVRLSITYLQLKYMVNRIFV
jgi:hypothetical protein